MLTRRFFILFLIVIAFGFVGLLWSGAMWASKAMLIVLLGLALIDAMITYIATRRLTVKRHVREHMSLNQPNAVAVELDIKLPTKVASKLQIEAYDCTPGKMQRVGNEQMEGIGTHTYHVYPKCRGVHEFKVIRCFVRTRGLGLFEARRMMHVLTQVKVYPTFHCLDKIEAQATRSNIAGSMRVRRPSNNTEFEQIRQYVPGDDIRTINWRATARSTQLMVNTYTDERSQPIIPVICAGPSMLIATEGITLLDRATSAAVALASAAVRHYDEAGLLTVTHKGVESYLKPERSNAVVAKMLECTYNFGLPPTQSESEYVIDADVVDEYYDEATVQRLRARMEACEADADINALAQYAETRISRKSMLVLFANFENIEVARQALPSLQRIAKRHALLVVLYADKGITSVAKSPYRDGEVSQRVSEKRFRALCADYLAQQQLLASYMRHHGINVILTEPEHLTSAVLQKYLEMKEMSVVS